MVQVIGFNFDKISVEKKKQLGEGLKINTNIEIKDIEFKEIEIFKNKEVVNFFYEINISYEPDYANLLFKGSILILIDEKSILNKIKESWKSKKIPEEIRAGIINIIFSRCNLKALQLEEDFALPPHIPMPKFSIPKEADNKK